jgi:chromosome segregation ATPase
MERLHRWIAVAAFAALAGSGNCGRAQVARSGGAANAELLQQLQQLASERTSMQAENERLKNQLAAVTKDRDALKAGQQILDRRSKDAAAALANSNTEREANGKELELYKTRMQELVTKFRETIQTLRESETEGASARQTLATRDHELAVCRDHNAALYHLDDQVLTRLEKEGFWSRFAEAEPFTRIKRPELENFADEQRALAAEQRAAPGPGSAGGQQAGVAPAPAAGSPAQPVRPQ